MATEVTTRAWLSATSPPPEPIIVIDEPLRILREIERALAGGMSKGSLATRLTWLDGTDPYSSCVVTFSTFAGVVCLPLQATEGEVTAVTAVLMAIAARISGSQGDVLAESALCSELARLLALLLREHGSHDGLVRVRGSLDALAAALPPGTVARLLIEQRAAWVGVLCCAMESEWAQTLDPDRMRGLLERLRAAIEDARTILAACSKAMGASDLPTDDLELRYWLIAAGQDLRGLELSEPVVWSAEWRVLIQAYRNIGNLVNAGAAAGMWLQSAIRTKRGMGVLSNEALDEIESTIRVGCEEPDADRNTRIRLRQLRSRFLALTGQYDEAETLIRLGVAEVVDMLALHNEPVVRSNLQSTGEDWIGVALLTDLRRSHRAGPLYVDAHVGIRGHDPIFPTVPPAVCDKCATLLIHRWATAGRRVSPGGDVAWIEGAFAEVAWEPLTRLHRLAARDLRKTRERGTSGYSEGSEWRRFLAVQADRIGLRRLAAAGDRVVVFSDRSDLPLTLMAGGELGAQAVAVLGRRTNLPARPTAPRASEGDPVRFINTFAQQDPMRVHLRDVFARGGGANWTWTDVASIQELRSELEMAARGIVVGLHGWVSDALAPGIVEVGTTKVASANLLDGVQLQRPDFTLLVSCFAASGFRDALGGGSSLVDQFLLAGSQTVIASPFPVFMDANLQVAQAMNSLLRRLSVHNGASEPMDVAEATTGMVGWLRARVLPPRFWAGLACWAPA